MDNYPIARELVLAGGGHSHVILLRMFAMNPVPGVHVTLISPEVETPYSGMLPGLIAGHYQRDEVYIDLAPLCRFAGAGFIKAAVASIDPVAQTVSMEGRPSIRYDCLSIDVGSTPSQGGLAGDDVIPVKPIGSFLDRWQRFVQRFEAGDVSDVGFVGAGAGGVELCLAVKHYLDNCTADNSPRLHLFTDGKTILREFPTSVRIRFERLLNDKRITVHRDFRADRLVDGALLAADGRAVRVDEVFCATQAAAQVWPSSAGLDVDAAGFVQVRDTLQTMSHDNIFAVGDCATMVNFPRPKAGVYAVRQGPPLYKNICRFLLGKSTQPFKPQSRFLALLTTGSKRAIASRNGFSIEGEWVWKWKNWIDRRFMLRFSALPGMKRESVNALSEEFDEQMQCGGCGSKVSADLLNDVLTELLGGDRSPDDAVRLDVPQGKSIIQSVDHFRAMIDDPYRQAKIAVCHALSDVYACGGQAHSVMAMLTLPFGKPDITRSLLRQLLAGAIEQLDEDGAQLIGGHTSEGVELSIGFSVNGLVLQSGFWQKQGLQNGDVLILTKPLGTGTVLAADMQHRARGQWVEAAIDSMMQSNRRAAEVLHRYSVSACTDVTGFGLAGHCQEMIAGSNLGIVFRAGSIPVLPGARQTLEQLGVTSTLHASNRLAAPVSGAHSDEMLFDPQTSGGLLAAIPESEAQACLLALRESGYAQACVVGVVSENPGLSLSE